MQKTQVSWEYSAQLDTRLRVYDGKAATFCLTREGGYPESIASLVFLHNRIPFYVLLQQTFPQ
jgi:hypothetical protein